MTDGGRLAGRVALVTGGGRGLGRAVAERYVREGAQVAIADIDGDLARDAAAALGEGGLGVQCDVARADDVERAFDACLERFGRIDILVNNAAVVGPAVKHFLEIDEATWDLVLDANLKGHFLCTRARRPPHGRAGRRRDHQHLERRRLAARTAAWSPTTRPRAASRRSRAPSRSISRPTACARLHRARPHGDLGRGRGGRGARPRDGADRAAGPPGHRRRHRGRGRLPGRRGRELPDRLVHLRRRRRARASSARREVETFPLERYPERVGRPGPRTHPSIESDTAAPSEAFCRHPRSRDVLERVLRRSPYDTRRSRRETPTIRGRPQLFHDLSDQAVSAHAA